MRPLATRAVYGQTQQFCLLGMAYIIAMFKLYISSRGLNGLREDPTTGEWEELSLCLGDDELCPGALTGQDIATFFTSLGEDEGG